MLKKGNVIIVHNVLHDENHSSVHIIHSEHTSFKTYAITIGAGCGKGVIRPEG